MPIDSRHPEYTDKLPQWEQIRDNLAGSPAIKEKGERYLPNPSKNMDDSSDIYEDYKKRALFFNMTSETLSFLIGKAFSTAPVYTGPDEMIPLIKNIDGVGVTAEQQQKCTTSHVSAYSRAGIFVDYPKIEGVPTKKDEEDGFVAPRVICYDPFPIINWRTITKGAKTMLDMVMIEEQYDSDDDGYEVEYDLQWRELYLDEGIYKQRLWRSGDGEAFEMVEEFTPRDYSGQSFTEIPFTFVGAESNEPSVEIPQMFDLSEINITHYQVSAEKMQYFYCLAPTMWISGLRDDWIEARFPGGRVPTGPKAAALLPDGGQMGIVEPSEKSAYTEELLNLENQARQIGAKLVVPSDVAKTATEADIDESTRLSVLAGNCNNVSAAYHMALGWAAAFSGVENMGEDYPEGATLEINTEFATVKLTQQEQMGIISSINAGLLSWTEGRKLYWQGGLASQSDDDVKEEHEAKEEDDFAKAAQAFQATKTQ